MAGPCSSVATSPPRRSRAAIDLTLFTRGVHGTDLFPEATQLVGDRAGDLSALEEGEWDAVIDTSGFQPEHVGRLCELLADRIGHYVFVSSCNAYPGWPEEHVDEDSPTWQTDDEEYGPQKAASERAAEAAMPGRFATVRAGLICGPHDNVFRLPWWVKRIAAGGRVPAPGDPARPVQLVDARDLAEWMLDLGEQRIAGAFNGTVAGRHADDGRGARGGGRRHRVGAELVWIPDERLQAAEVAAVGGAPAVDPRGGIPGHLDDRHRARAGVRAALPADRRDRRRRLGVAARRRRSRAGRVALRAPPAADAGWLARRLFWVSDARLAIRLS